jgi:tripartite-type tricarboxylate transporter receptor subunit TctC
MRVKQLLLAGLTCTGALAAPAQAQYPERAIKLVVPQAAGSATDNGARILAQELSKELGQSVIIENRPGSAFVVGNDAVAKAQPDGYTLLVTPSAVLTINPHLYSKLAYNPLKDFAWVTAASNSPYLLVVHASIPVTSVKELIAYARARPGQLNYSSAGNGSSAHLSGVLFAQMAGVTLVHVPYKGAAPGLIALLAGDVQLRFSSVVPALPHVRSGKLRALGVTSKKRYGPLPDVPAIAEAGVPGYAVESFYAVVAPAGTPQPVIAKVNAELVRNLKSDDVKAKMAADGAEAIGSTPEELGKWIREDLARWAKPVKESGARID